MMRKFDYISIEYHEKIIDLRCLDDRERQIIEYIFFENWKIKEIAIVFNLTPQWIYKIKKSALQKLKDKIIAENTIYQSRQNVQN